MPHTHLEELYILKSTCVYHFAHYKNIASAHCLNPTKANINCTCKMIRIHIWHQNISIQIFLSVNSAQKNEVFDSLRRQFEFPLVHRTSAQAMVAKNEGRHRGVGQERTSIIDEPWAQYRMTCQHRMTYQYRMTCQHRMTQEDKFNNFWGVRTSVRCDARGQPQQLLGVCQYRMTQEDKLNSV